MKQKKITYSVILMMITLFGGALPTWAKTKNTSSDIAAENWPIYKNNPYKFQYHYPPDSKFGNKKMDHQELDLPVYDAQTNLADISLSVDIFEPDDPSTNTDSLDTNGAASESVVIGENNFKKETGGSAGAGNYYEDIFYSISRNGTTVKFHFIIHSVNANMIEPPQKEFERSKVEQMIHQILSSFKWTQ